MKRNVYLDMISLADVKERLEATFGVRRTEAETVLSQSCAGRVLAEPVFAKTSSPGYHASAMDGYAVKANETYGASEGHPLTFAIGKEAHPVNTGHRLPEGCDAVIMIEAVNPKGDTHLEIDTPAYPFQHVRKMGEDMVATELLFPTGHTLTPYCVGALITAGVHGVRVHKKPRVLVVPTGSELVTLDGPDARQPKPGKIFESNSHMLAAMVEETGCAAICNPIIQDDPEAIGACIKEAANGGEVDAILLIGGSSAGSEDHARRVVEAQGELIFHGVTIMPGKPVLAGSVDGVPLFGMPGYPVSAIVAFEQCVAPLLASLGGRHLTPRPKAEVTLSRNITSRLGLEEFMRVKLGRVGEQLIATPIAGGSGTLTSITEADGIVRIPTHLEGLPSGEPTPCELLRPPAILEQTLVTVGSHDNTLDLVADALMRRSGKSRLISSHVGSMGGIMALKRGVCHMAGIHLLDEKDGSYNTSYVERYLKGKDLTLVNLVTRQQGLIVAKGNPLGIQGIEDLSKNGIRFVNRQGGSGTRILLDYKLKELGIEGKEIDGYTRDEYTHMSVAVAVLSGTADAGLGIYAAAKALDLSFIPVVTEAYELLMGSDILATPMGQELMETLTDDAFKERVEALGGYSTEKTGTIVRRFTP